MTKTIDWAEEKEYRLVLSSILTPIIDKKNRKLKYNFNSLKGLIFGMETPNEEKLKIIEIIKDKCKKNNINDFEFYQAYYCQKNESIQHRRMSFIKLN